MKDLIESNKSSEEIVNSLTEDEAIDIANRFERTSSKDDLGKVVNKIVECIWQGPPKARFSKKGSGWNIQCIVEFQNEFPLSNLDNLERAVEKTYDGRIKDFNAKFFGKKGIEVSITVEG